MGSDIAHVSMVLSSGAFISSALRQRLSMRRSFDWDHSFDVLFGAAGFDSVDFVSDFVVSLEVDEADSLAFLAASAPFLYDSLR